jgi:hypothetical protein
MLIEIGQAMVLTLASTTNLVGGPSFAQFAKGGNRECLSDTA